MSRLLAFFLLLLFSLQALPVRELGKAFVKKAATAQSADDTDNDEEGLKEKAVGLEYLPGIASCIARQIFIPVKIFVQTHGQTRVPASHHFEVATPPPDPVS